MSYVHGTKHGLANCIAFSHLKDFYGDAVDEYNEMVKYHNIDLPKNLAPEWTDEEIQKMSEVAYNLPHMWTHAIGHDWQEKWTVDDVAKYYRMM
jgi:3-deoxy-alpha-D-manno-octulosonate 8-oxidase